MIQNHSAVYENYLKSLLNAPSLNLGSSDFKIGDINVDIDKEANPDILFNLESFPYPLKSNSFNSIIMHHSFEHLDSPENVLKECKSLMKDGGRIIIVVPSPENKNYRMNGHKSFFTKKSIESIVKKHFRCVKVFGYRRDTKNMSPLLGKIFGMFSPNQYFVIGEK